MFNILDQQVIPMLSPTAVRVIDRLLKGISFGHATRIWDTAVHVWRHEDEETRAIFQETLDELVEYDESWIDFRDDVVSLLASYDEFKTQETPIDVVSMRLLLQSHIDNVALVRNIAALEGSKRAVEATKATDTRQRISVQTQGPMGGSGGGWTC